MDYQLASTRQFNGLVSVNLGGIFHNSRVISPSKSGDRLHLPLGPIFYFDYSPGSKAQVDETRALLPGAGVFSGIIDEHARTHP